MNIEQQREEARRKANMMRAAKAAVCRAMRRGNMTLEESMRHPCVHKMPIHRLLRCLPHVGEMRAELICMLAHVEPSRPVGLLSTRDRAALLAGRELAEDEVVQNKRAAKRRAYWAKKEAREAAKAAV